MAAQLQVICNDPPEDRSQPEIVKPGTGFIEKFAKGKSVDEVVKVLYNGIVRYAGLKEFLKAEQLRDKLTEVAPIAIQEIVNASEIIEKEKIAAMQFEKIKPWAELFNAFTSGEAASLYFVLKFVSVKKHQKIFKQGECDNRLFFIESGAFKLSYYDSQMKKNIVFAQLRKGDTCGAEAFFTYTPHTTTLTALEDSTISYLEKKAYQKLKSDYPAIEPKLICFCEKNQKKVQAQNPQNMERRAHQRYQISLKGLLQRIDDRGNLLPQSLTVTVLDISVGGVCLMARNMGIGDAANYHQSTVQVTISYQKHFITYDITKVATVVSVRLLPFGECSVHLEFKTPLEEAKIIEIAKYTNIPTYL